jgi:ADP-ribosylation factor-like protein 8
MGNLLAWFRDAFWSKEMELSVVGLSNAGKSTLCAAFAIGSGYAMDDMIPTVGFNMRQVKRNNVVMKIWDLGGQSRFKSLWERYCKGVTAIVYVVDASNHEQIDASKTELHELMAKVRSSRLCACVCALIMCTSHLWRASPC